MRANRVDANQTEIVDALRKAGAEWIPTSGDPSIGFDGLVAFRGVLHIAEIKDGSKPPSGRKLTDRERKRKEQVEYKGVKYNVIESKEDALKLIGVIR
jgi:hypothetical protein